MSSRQVSVSSYLFISLALIILVLSSSSILFLIAITCLLLFAIILSGALREHYTRYFAILLFIFVGVFPLVWEKNATGSIYSWSSWSISIGGLMLASQVALRAIATCSIMCLLLYLVPIYHLCQTLRRLKVPHLLIELIELSYRYINLLLERTEYIRDAQLLRLGYDGVRQKYRDSALLLSQTFVLAHAESEYMYEGLQTRQFDEHREQCDFVKDVREQSESIIRLQGISYKYPRAEVLAVKDVSLSIGPGERIVLLGANGAGKSSLMRLLAGLQREQSGLFYLDGKQLGATNRDLRYQRKRVALVMQNANHQLFCPSVEDEIAFGLSNSGIEGEELQRRVDLIIECYDLEELRGVPPHLLSEGQKKWVSIAAIMALEPDIILMDEPTACLDCYYTERVMHLAREFCRSGRSVILSTHDMNLALHWANRGIVMAEGQVIYDGDIHNLYADKEMLQRAKLNQPHGFRAEPRYKPISISEHSCDVYRLGLFHNTEQMSVLVVGGGRGAERKIKTLVQAGVQRIIVLAPYITEVIQEYVDIKRIEWVLGTYVSGQVDLDDYHMIVAAVGVSSIDKDICRDAYYRGKLICNASNPLEGNVQFGAQGNRYGLQFAVHTSYSLPEIAQHLRDLVLGKLKEEYHNNLIQLQRLRRENKELYGISRDRFIEQINNDWFNRG